MKDKLKAVVWDVALVVAGFFKAIEDLGIRVKKLIVSHYRRLQRKYWTGYSATKKRNQRKSWLVQSTKNFIDFFYWFFILQNEKQKAISASKIVMLLSGAVTIVLCFVVMAQYILSGYFIQAIVVGVLLFISGGLLRLVTKGVIMKLIEKKGRQEIDMKRR